MVDKDDLEAGDAAMSSIGSLQRQETRVVLVRRPWQLRESHALPRDRVADVEVHRRPVAPAAEQQAACRVHDQDHALVPTAAAGAAGLHPGDEAEVRGENGRAAAAARRGEEAGAVAPGAK